VFNIAGCSYLIGSQYVKGRSFWNSDAKVRRYFVWVVR